MAECSAAPAPKKKKKYLVNLNTKWSDKHSFIKQSRKGDTFTFCEFCRSDFSVGHGGKNDVKKHIATPKHREYCDVTKWQKKLTNWTSSSAKHLEKQAIRAEVLFSGFLVEHNLPLATTEYMSKLFKSMFPDSQIASMYKCGRTKTSHIFTGTVAKNVMKDIKEEIIAHWFGLATDGSSDEDDKFLPILIRHIEKDSGCIKTSLLNKSDINSCSTAEQMSETSDTVIKSFSLDRNNYVLYSSDNTNSMIGKRKSLLKRITNVQGNQKTFDVGCPCHLAHLCAGKGAKELSVNVEDFVIDLYYHFRRSAKRKAQLREYIEFNNNAIRKIIKHVSTRWLSLEKSLERTLKQWDSLESCFISLFDLDDNEESEDDDKPSLEKR